MHEKLLVLFNPFSEIYKMIMGDTPFRVESHIPRENMRASHFFGVVCPVLYDCSCTYNTLGIESLGAADFGRTDKA